MIYPAKWFTEDIVFMIGTNVPFILNIECGAADYNMTGTQIDLTFKDRSGNVIQALSTAGVTPLLTINNSELTISPAAFTNAGRFKYYMKQTSGTTFVPIGKGTAIISAE
jgi:hypothetical protein